MASGVNFNEAAISCKDGGAIEAGSMGLGGCLENQLAQLLRRVPGNNFELAAIFQQLGQPLMDELPRIGIKGFADIVFQFAASPAFLGPEELQQTFRDRQPHRVLRIDVIRQDAVTGVTDAKKFACEHGKN